MTSSRITCISWFEGNAFIARHTLFIPWSRLSGGERRLGASHLLSKSLMIQSSNHKIYFWSPFSRVVGARRNLFIEEDILLVALQQSCRCKTENTDRRSIVMWKISASSTLSRLFHKGILHDFCEIIESGGGSVVDTHTLYEHATEY
jgi:hypothetical protein